jgi:hypothetical protein
VTTFSRTKTGTFQTRKPYSHFFYTGKKEKETKSKPKIFITNFNPNRCNICYNNAVSTTLNVKTDVSQKIKFCQACKLVGYCSQEHQLLDWKIHKDMCRPIQKIMIEKKIEHILDINKPIKNASKKDFEEAIIVVKYLLVGVLKRPLLPFEEKVSKRLLFNNFISYTTRICFL